MSEADLYAILVAAVIGFAIGEIHGMRRGSQSNFAYQHGFGEGYRKRIEDENAIAALEKHVAAGNTGVPATTPRLSNHDDLHTC